MRVNAQISVYPLRKEHLTPAIDTVRTALEGYKLEPKVGSLSTLVTGESSDVFAALREAFERDAAQGDVVMDVTLANSD